MSSKRDLNKDLIYVLGDIIEAVYIWEMTNPDKGIEASGKIIDEAIEVFDELIQKVNDRSVEDKKQHFKGINQELETRGRALIDKINAL